YMVQAEQGPIVFGGFIGDPASSRGNSQWQYLFLNGRWVRDRALFQAVQDAYRGLLMTGRYPVAFLFLELQPEEVDVNVHPTKAEVRFRDADAIYRLVHDAVRARLQEADLTGRMQLDERAESPPRVPGVSPLPPPAEPALSRVPAIEPLPAPRDMPAAARITAPPVPAKPPLPRPSAPAAPPAGGSF